MDKRESRAGQVMEDGGCFPLVISGCIPSRGGGGFGVTAGKEEHHTHKMLEQAMGSCRQAGQQDGQCYHCSAQHSSP